MRPDRIIVGEVRGAEAFDMLQAMNTGHDGSISTVHANSARDALTRIENMVQMGQVNLPSRAIRFQIVARAGPDRARRTHARWPASHRPDHARWSAMEGDVITTNDIAAVRVQGGGRPRTDNGRLQVHPGRSEIQEPSCLLRARSGVGRSDAATLMLSSRRAGAPPSPAKLLRDAHISGAGRAPPSPAKAGEGVAEGDGWGVARRLDANCVAQTASRSDGGGDLLSTPHPSGFARHLPQQSWGRGAWRPSTPAWGL